MKGNSQKAVVEFETTQIKGLHHLNRIAKTIRSNKNIKITYQPFGKAESTVLDVSPQLIKEYNNRWFCFVCNASGELSNLALDRIVSIENSETVFHEYDLKQLKEILKNIIGVTIPKIQKIETVEFKVNNKRAPYIETKPLHPSQTSVKKKAYTLFKIKVIPNLELEALLLNYGKDIEVLRPLELRERIKQQLEIALNHYL